MRQALPADVRPLAGVIAHVPAGLGVLEAVFVALLGGQVPTEPLLAALLAYRGLYYVAPLLAATLLYAAFEVGAQRGARTPGRVVNSYTEAGKRPIRAEASSGHASSAE